MKTEENTAHFQLFYLIGFQRSGTTLLCHLLDKHPQILCAEEPEISKRIVFKQFEILRDADYDSIKQSLDHYKVESGRYSELVEQYLGGSLDEDGFIRNVYSLFNKKNATYIGAKEVIDLSSSRSDYFKRLLEMHDRDFKVIFLERDIKGIVNSFIKMGFFPNEVFPLPRGKKKINNFFLKLFARKYIKAQSRVLRLLSRVDSLHLFYDDLLDNPEKELMRIYRFLGVDYSHETLKNIINTSSHGIRCDYKGITKETAAGWEKGLAPNHIAWLDKLAGKLDAVRAGNR